MEKSKHSNTNLAQEGKDSLGELIRTYRVRKSLSQMELELAIDAALGSVSRFELGKVNPSKETLGKMIEVLELSPLEAAKLYDVNINYFAEMINLANKINTVQSIEELFRMVITEISDILSLTGGAMYVVEGNKLVLKALTDNTLTMKALSFLPFPFEKIHFQLKPDSPNTIVQSVFTKKIISTNKLSQTVTPIISENLADTIQKYTKIKTVLVTPYLYNSVCIGTSAFGKLDESTETEREFLRVFSDAVGLKLAEFVKKK
jgi:transcriptional regulator with XRE-family HTH domain